VFGTLHTSSAAKTIDRIVDVFPAAEKDMVRAMMSESLRARDFANSDEKRSAAAVLRRTKS